MRRICALCILVIVALAQVSIADVPQKMSYQGVLKNADGSVVDDGDYGLTFRLYDSEAAGTELWSGTQTVTVTDGIFGAILGETTPLMIAFDAQYWLGVQVELDPELTPRVQLTAAPYALRAKTAEVADDDWVISGNDIYRLTGFVGIGTAAPTTELDVAGTAKVEGLEMPSGAADGYVLTSDAVGVGTWQAPTGGIGGSGAANHIPRFTGPTTLGISTMYELNDMFVIPPIEAAGRTPKDDELERDRLTSRLGVDGNNGRTLYAKVTETNTDEEGRTAIWAQRERDVPNDGTGYELQQTNNAITAYNRYGDEYTFGVAGYSMSVGDAITRHGGVLGFERISNSWGALGYVDESSIPWGVYTPQNTYIGGNVVLPAGAADGYVLTSDTAGIGTWQAPAAVSDGDWTISGDNQYSAVSGNVGIGTPSPSKKLSVVGSAYITGRLGVGTTVPPSIRALEVVGDSGFHGTLLVWSDDPSMAALYGIDTSGTTGVGVIGECHAEEGFGYGGAFYGSYCGASGECDGEGDGYYRGIWGRAYIDNPYAAGYGLVGTAYGDTGTKFGVYGYAQPGGTSWAGYFAGALYAESASSGIKDFKIDHPLDPANKYLNHSSVESSDRMNIYNGNVVLDAGGKARVELPEWFEVLNRDFRYQLTCIGGFAPVYVAQKIEGGRFQIAGGDAGMEVSWQVTGIRHDPLAEAHRIQVEEDKPSWERGKYLTPEVYGQPRTMAMDYVEPVEPEWETPPVSRP